MAEVPVGLHRDTIVEAYAEVRFAPGQDSAGAAMPGVVHAALKSSALGPIAIPTPLPLAQIPAALRDQQPALVYAPLYVIEGAGFRLLLGPRSVGISVARPYPGWDKFRPTIAGCVKAVLASGLQGSVERISLRYTNIVDVGDAGSLAALELKCSVPGLKFRGEGLSFKGEVDDGGCINIINVATETAAQFEGTKEEVRGVLVGVDTILAGQLDDLAQRCEQLFDQVHTAEKKVFFSLLTEDTVNALKDKGAVRG